MAQSEAIGRLLYQFDRAADIGTTFLARRVTENENRALAGSFTCIDESNEKREGDAFVSIFLTKENPARVAYRVHMSNGREPTLEKVFPPAQAESSVLSQFRAFHTAVAAVPKGERPMKSAVFPGRFVGRPDSLVVYLLTPEQAPNELALGMHYRVLVSADGTAVEQVEALTDVPFIDHLGPGLPGHTSIQGDAHLDIEYPPETDVYLSLSHDRLPLAIMTRRTVWLVIGDEIGILTPGPPAPADLRAFESRRAMLARKQHPKPTTAP